jgi:hypothetical protein
MACLSAILAWSEGTAEPIVVICQNLGFFLAHGTELAMHVVVVSGLANSTSRNLLVFA